MDLGVLHLSHGDSRGDLMRQLVSRYFVDASRHWYPGHSSSCQGNASPYDRRVEPIYGSSKMTRVVSHW